MGSNLPTNQHLLFVCAALCLLACLRNSHPSAADAPCPPNYPAVRLLNFCPPAPAWCRRLRGHVARNWRHCRPRCKARLDFGKRRFPVAWSSAKGAKLPVFGLAVPGWHQRTLTIWRKKLYAKRSHGQSAWQIVYPVSGRLVAVAISAKPPYDCGRRHSMGGRNKSRTKPALRRRLRGLRARCFGNTCSVRLPLHRLMKAAAKLRGRSHRYRKLRAVALQLTLTTKVGRAQFVMGELLPLTGATRGFQRKREEEDDPASAYRKFLGNQRENYWRTKGWRDNARRKKLDGSRRGMPGLNARVAKKKWKTAPSKPVRIEGTKKRQHVAATEEIGGGTVDKSVQQGLADLFKNEFD